MIPRSLAFVGASLAVAAPALSRSEPTNVLILLADDVGVDHVTCYGEGPLPASTPNIDGLAAQGVLFRNAWVAPVCSATRAQILTGRHAFRTGIGHVADKYIALDPAEVTVPEVLDLHPHFGYRHAAFGKWHLGNAAVGGDLAPNVSGWDHFAGTTGNIQKPESYYFWTRVENGVAAPSTTYSTTRIVDDFLDWHSGVDGPWVAYVAFHAGHFPFHEPPAHLHTVPIPDQSDPRTDPIPYYRAMVEAMDSEVGRLLAGLGEDHDDTNIIFLGDNGTERTASIPPFLPAHAKRSPYEGGLNVPLIIAGPAVVEPGREVEALVSGVDLYDTSLTLAGIDVNAVTLPERDAVDLFPYLRNPARDHKPLRKFAYQEYFFPNGPGPHSIDYRIARDNRFKLIRDLAKGREELYDLHKDPFEKTNILERGLNPKQQARYQALFDHIEDQIG